jgi:hypothetical protein
MTVIFYYSVLPFVPLCPFETKRGSNFYFRPGMYFQTGQVIFVPEWPKGEFVSILASFCVWTKSLKCKDAVNRDSTIQNLQVRRIQVPCQPSGHPSIHCSIIPDDVSSRPDARQTNIIRPDEMFIPSGPHTVSRSFCASLHPSGRFSITSECLPAFDQLLISFQVPRKGNLHIKPASRRCCHSVRMVLTLLHVISITSTVFGRCYPDVWTIAILFHILPY